MRTTVVPHAGAGLLDHSGPAWTFPAPLRRRDHSGPANTAILLG